MRVSKGGEWYERGDWDWIRSETEALGCLKDTDVGHVFFYGRLYDIGRYSAALRVLVKLWDREKVRAFLKKRIPEGLHYYERAERRDLEWDRWRIAQRVFELVMPPVLGFSPIPEKKHTTSSDDMGRALRDFEEYRAFVARYLGKRIETPRWLSDYEAILGEGRIPEGFPLFRFPEAHQFNGEGMVHGLPDFHGLDGPGTPDANGRPWWPTEPSFNKREKADYAADSLRSLTWLMTDVRVERTPKKPERFRVWVTLPTTEERDRGRSMRDLGLPRQTWDVAERKPNPEKSVTWHVRPDQDTDDEAIIESNLAATMPSYEDTLHDAVQKAKPEPVKGKTILDWLDAWTPEAEG